MRKRFVEQGLDQFTAVQALEILLFYCIPRQDTNVLAHRLINHFGSFSQVLDADIADLLKVEGIGENTAIFLKMIPAAGRYYNVDRVRMTDIPLVSTEACGEYLLPYFQGRCNEMVLLLCLDAKCKPLCCRVVGEGSINSAAVPVRRVVEMALAAKATSVVLAHNHPSGIALPSNEDIVTTRRIVAALEAVEIMLSDHLVVADNDYISMVQSGFIRPAMEF